MGSRMVRAATAPGTPGRLVIDEPFAYNSAVPAGEQTLMSRAVLVVCVGNICRSPMAAALLGSKLADMTVSSAGIGAVVGSGADPAAIALMQQRGLDLTDHVARQLDEDIMRGSDMVLTMEQQHTRWITERWPQFTGRVFRWGHWQDFDVPDPYCRGDDAFKDALQLIDSGLEAWVSRLQRMRA